MEKDMEGSAPLLNSMGEEILNQLQTEENSPQLSRMSAQVAQHKDKHMNRRLAMLPLRQTWREETSPGELLSKDLQGCWGT